MAQEKILFIGNSFTLGWQTPVATYDASNVHDLDATSYGGVPGLFKEFADIGGFDVDVSVDAIPGSTLSDHLANDSGWLGKMKWDWIVLQDLSTRPLPSQYGGNIPQFIQDVSAIHALAAAANPDVKMALYETWARPDLVPGQVPSLDAMQEALHGSYATAASDFSATTMVPVGDAFLTAIDQGLADDPTTDAVEGPIGLWNGDRYHASVDGSYLSAMMFYSTILHGDPTALPNGDGSTRANLGIDVQQAMQLESLASQMTPATLNPAPEPSSITLLALVAVLFSAARIRSARKGSRREITA